MSNQIGRITFSNWTRPIIPDGSPTTYGWVVRYPKLFGLGEFTDIGYGTYIQAKYGVIIGEFVQIGAHCAIYSASTIDDKFGPVRIDEYAKIGSGSVVMPGVHIGKWAVVGALSFVNRSIPAFQVWGGNPIRYLKDIEEVGRG